MAWQDDPVVSWQDDPVVTPYEKQAQTDTGMQNLLAAVGGAMKAPYVGIRQAVGSATPGEVDEWKKSMEGLWTTKAGKAGTILGGAAAAAPVAFIPGANTLAGSALAGAAVGAMQPVTGDDSRVVNSLEGLAGGMAGKVGGDLIGKAAGSFFGNRAVDMQAQRGLNSMRDATLNDAKAAGYVIPPTQANPMAPGGINRMLEGLSGKIQTAQAAGIKNQPVTDALAKQALGLPPDVPLNARTLQQVRDGAGALYGQLKKFGPVSADQQFGQDMQKVVGEYVSLAQNMPSQRIPKIDALLEDLNKPGFSSSDAVELVKRLRHDGFKNMAAIDPETKLIGRVQIGAQNAIEDMLDRNLAQSGNAGFLDSFRKARALIAKTYTVENALEESTGKVVAAKIGKEFSKGRPLTGELATIGRTAEAFPKAVQNVNTSMPGLSPLDAGASLAALIGAVGTGNPNAAWLAAAPLARPAVRSMLLSKPYQSAMVNSPSYAPGMLTNGSEALLTSPRTKKALAALLMSLPAVQQ